MSPKTTRSVFEPIEHGSSRKHQIWSGLRGSADALAITSAATATDETCLVICENARKAEALFESLHFFKSKDSSFPIAIFPSWECLPYDNFSPHSDIVSRRIELLYRLPALKRAIVVVSVDNLMQRLPPVSQIMQSSFKLDVGDRLDPDQFQLQLINRSYHSVSQVEGPGEFAIRGGIIDVFPTGCESPVRIELFDNAIETLRYFDSATQLSTRQFNSLRMLPGNEIRNDEHGIALFRQSFRKHIEGDPQDNAVYREFSTRKKPDGAEFYLPLFFESVSSLLDYVPASATVFFTEDTMASAKEHWIQVQSRYEKAKDEITRYPLPPEMLYLDPQQLEDSIMERKTVHICRNHAQTADCNFNTLPALDASVEPGSGNPYKALLEHLGDSSRKILIAIDNLAHVHAIEAVLARNATASKRVESWQEFVDSDLLGVYTVNADMVFGINLPDEGIAAISNNEIHGRRIQVTERKPRWRSRNPESVIASLEELQPGDAVVHDSHGIGRYQGLKTLDIDGNVGEFLTINYAGTDTLYVPVYSFDSVSRYISGDKDNIPLHSLSSKKWATAKRKAKEKAFDVAAELLEIQSLRDSFGRPAYELKLENYSEFASRFAYDTTPDQETAIRAVLDDLQAPRPMDRLVCGDVGFGKTEVALRAAFVAVADSRQVAIIAPTTLLAQQHFDVFSERFAEYPVNIELLSRLRAASSISNAVEKIREGKVDIAIGTHRLLQQDIEFGNLGLVIVDEEHRFGVRQKEYLKKLRTGVDVLTLTATPIPRTLSMALNEIRDISIIATPPDSRHSVRTFVRQWSSGLIREACLRELGRGGQIFYLHNDVKSINAAAKELSRIVPEASIEIAHGQMPKRDLASVMRNFYLNRFDTLVCSTIIESGIDIPSANTIIINSASRFGLAQLHQLRGRVGRSHHQAYAYLLVPDISGLNKISKLRLDAIESFDQLGVGFVIASHDLEIRGAGTILGEAQSGVMHDVGFSLYNEYLTDAVKSLKKTGAPPAAKSDISSHFSSEINLNAPALFPEKWIPDVNTRLSLYKRLAGSATELEIEDLQVQMQDRFGKLPPDALRLFEVAKIKLKSTKLGIRKLTMSEKFGQVRFAANADIDVEGLFALIGSYPGEVRLNEAESAIMLKHDLRSPEQRAASVQHVLEAITPS